MPTMETFKTEAHRLLERRARTAEYVVALYEFHCARATDRADGGGLPLVRPTPPPISFTLMEDCDGVARVLAQAVRNIFTLSWDANAYAADLPKKTVLSQQQEANLLIRYPPIGAVRPVTSPHEPLPVVRDPAVFVDQTGRILVWSLPSILPRARQQIIQRATDHLKPLLKTKKPKEGEAETKNWRNSARYFTPSVTWGAGAVLLYPAGFQQGHTGRKFQPAPSRDCGSHAASEWMAALDETSGLLDGILAVTHPKLYDTARRLTRKVLAMKSGRSPNAMINWPSSFNSVHVLVNRLSLRHRDKNTSPGWLDMLLTLGSYGQTGILELRNLGASVPYDSGSMAMLSSRLVRHGVPRVDGDRICYAFYMVTDIHTWFEMEDPGFATLDDVTNRDA